MLWNAGNGEEITDMPQYLDEAFGGAWKAAHTANGYNQPTFRRLDTPLQSKQKNVHLSIGDQLPFCGRLQTLLASISAAAKIHHAQLNTGSQGPGRKEAFMALIGATGAGETPRKAQHHFIFPQT